MNWDNILGSAPIAAVAAIFGWFVNTVFKLWSQTSSDSVAKSEIDHKIKSHSETVTLELLELAHNQVHRLTAQLEDLDQLKERARYVEEALTIIENLISADESNRAFIEYTAREFIVRLRAAGYDT